MAIKSGISAGRTLKAERSVMPISKPTGTEVANMRRNTSALPDSPIELSIVTKVPYKPHSTALAMTMAADKAKSLFVFFI